MSGTLWDAPNQQVVREDESPPWEEGMGGGGNPDPQTGGLDSMTKPELLDHAHGLGLDDVSDSDTKAEIRKRIDEAGQA